MPRKVVKTIYVYKFNELEEDVQERVINDIIQSYLVSGLWKNYPDMVKAVQKAEQKGTPWYAASYMWDYAKSTLLEDAYENEYTENGEIYTDE